MRHVVRLYILKLHNQTISNHVNLNNRCADRTSADTDTFFSVNYKHMLVQNTNDKLKPLVPI